MSVDSTTPTTGLKARLEETRKKYGRYQPALFFIAGFLLDVFTFSRIDDALGIIQQAAYLILIVQILKYRTLEASGAWQVSPKWAKLWKYNDEALHFILGSLLSLYTIFYFVSSSLATSFIFMALIIGLLVANELPGVQKSGLLLKYALYVICLYSFLFIMIALTLGFVGIVPFVLALALGLAAVFGLYKALSARLAKSVSTTTATRTATTSAPSIALDLRRLLGIPAIGVAAVLVILYTLKLLPPIPLSIQHIGIYHQIEKVRPPTGETKFVLKYDRPFWKFWQNGAQDFYAEPGDKIHAFIRIFAPRNFRDQIVFHWLKKEGSDWQSRDRIANQISGGRDQGFRGFAIKSNYEPGDWRVQIETTDGREVGRIDFTVTLEPTKNLVREYRTDEF